MEKLLALLAILNETFPVIFKHCARLAFQLILLSFPIIISEESVLCDAAKASGGPSHSSYLHSGLASVGWNNLV